MLRCSLTGFTGANLNPCVTITNSYAQLCDLYKKVSKGSDFQNCSDLLNFFST